MQKSPIQKLVIIYVLQVLDSKVIGRVEAYCDGGLRLHGIHHADSNSITASLFEIEGNWEVIGGDCWGVRLGIDVLQYSLICVIVGDSCH